VALAVIAALRGARIIRAHDVAATVDALKVAIAVEAGG
jgi:dihydropteroate synthase